MEITYRDNYKLVDVTSKSVAEIRQQYKDDFSIPDKTRAHLNGKPVKRNQEQTIGLNSNDRLHFQDRSLRLPLLLGLVLFVLAISSGVFAYGATSTSVSLALSNQPDFAGVTANSTLTWNVFGSYTGTIPTGNLYTVTPDSNFTGDMEVVLTLANRGDLIDTYQMLCFEIEIYDSQGTPVQVGSTEWLSFSIGEIVIAIDQTGKTPPYKVELTDGFYTTHQGGWTTGHEDPTILIDVLQKGSQ